MQVLKLGSLGSDVARWQHFLVGKGVYQGAVESSFGPKTEEATRKFQIQNRVHPADGIVGRATWAVAIGLGFGEVTDDGEAGSNWPPRPSLNAPSQALRDLMFGKFQFKAAPTKDNPERIEVTDDWVTKNLVEVEIPQLRGIRGAPADCKVKFHRKVAPKVQLLFSTWEKEGLLNLVLTWNGSYVPRFIRGSSTSLSAHSHGSAFDLNSKWNPLGADGPLVGEEGSTRKLAEVAGRFNWFWGGWYKGRTDPMHFEFVP